MSLEDDRPRKTAAPLVSFQSGSYLTGSSSPLIFGKRHAQGSISLAVAWGAVVSQKNSSGSHGSNDALAYAQEYSADFVLDEIAPPSMSDFRFLEHVLHSAPGRECIPYEGCCQAGVEGAATLYFAMRWLCFGGLLDRLFNETLHHFLPKKPLPHDNVEVQRKPFELRSIGFKNTDNKIIGGVSNRALLGGVSQSLCQIQRGFVHGRNAINNVVDLDSASRCYAMAFPESIPVLAGFDFGTAFPFLAHE